MTLEIHPAAEALQLEHCAYCKDFDVNIIPVLGQLEEKNVLMIWLITTDECEYVMFMSFCCSNGSSTKTLSACMAEIEAGVLGEQPQPNF